MKYLILVFTLAVLHKPALSCDNCNVYIGINPNDFEHSVKLVHRYQSRLGVFNNAGQQTLLRHGETGKTFYNKKVEDFYRNTQMQLKYFVNPRFSLSVHLPFVNNYRSENEVLTSDIKGIGDARVLANYRVVNSTKSDSSRVLNHRLEIMFGAKLPTGQFAQADVYGHIDHDLQVGTGSLDPLLGLNYTLMHRQFGLVNAFNSRLKGRSMNDYIFGNTLNFSSNIFFRTKGNLVLMPIVGYYKELKGKDVMNGKLIDYSEVNIDYVRAVLSIFYSKFSMSFEILKPINQKRIGNNLSQRDHFNVSFTYYFKQKNV